MHLELEVYSVLEPNLPQGLERDSQILKRQSLHVALLQFGYMILTPMHPFQGILRCFFGTIRVSAIFQIQPVIPALLTQEDREPRVSGLGERSSRNIPPQLPCEFRTECVHHIYIYFFFPLGIQCLSRDSAIFLGAPNLVSIPRKILSVVHLVVSRHVDSFQNHCNMFDRILMGIGIRHSVCELTGNLSNSSA